MQNLVSKNPVQRFKQGKQIVKFEIGGETKSYKSNYNRNYEGLGSKLKRWISNWTWDQNRVVEYPNRSLVQQSSVQQNTTPKQITIDEVISSNDPKQLLAYTYQNKDKGPITVSTNVENQQSKTKSTYPTPVNNNSIFLDPMGGWKRNMGDKILDTESQNMLKELGWTGNAKEIQRLLNQNNIGGYEVKEDNRWGNQSKSALKAYYDRWKKSLNPQPKVTYVSPQEAIKAPEVQQEIKNWMNQEAISQNPIVQTEQNIINNNKLSFERNANLNKSQTRDLMRSFGLNPYDFSGAQRKALRLYKNGLSDDVSLLRGTPLYDLFVTPYQYKTGGQLVSRNPIKRFKSNFR